MPSKRAIIRATLVFVVLFLGAIFIIRRGPAKGVKARIERIRHAGLPISAEGLNAWYGNVPTNENKALPLLDAIRLATRPTQALDEKLSGNIDPDTERELAEFLVQNETALEKIHLASTLPKSRFPVDMSPGFAMALPHLSGMKSLVSLTKYEAIYKARRKDTEGACQALRSGFAVANALRREPLFISDLVGVACVFVAVSSLERVLSETPLNSEQLVMFSPLLVQAETEGLRGLERAMITERAAGISAFQSSFQNIQAFGGAPAGGTTPNNWLRVLGYQAYVASGMRERDLDLYLEAMDSIIESTKMGFPQALANSSNAWTQLEAKYAHGLGRFAILSRMVLPALRGGIDKEAGMASRLRCANVALAIERFRLDHEGALPETLELLAPQYIHILPRDPFDGRPLVFEKLPQNGYKVLSEGFNASRKRAAGRDVAFEVKR